MHESYPDRNLYGALSVTGDSFCLVSHQVEQESLVEVSALFQTIGRTAEEASVNDGDVSALQADHYGRDAVFCRSNT